MNACPPESTLLEFTADTLSPNERSLVMEHLALCHACRCRVPETDRLRRAGDTERFQLPPRPAAERAVPNEGFDPGLIDRVYELGKQLFASATTVPEKLDVGTTLHWSQPIGRGGLGEVARFRDAQLERDVAVKFIGSSANVPGPAIRERFLREYKITSFLDHPGVPPVYGIGQTREGRPFYVMRYVLGPTLHAVIHEFHERPDAQLERSFFPFRTVLAHFRRVCETVDHAHRRQVLHRDLKPQNVIAEQDATVVIDWGLAKTKNEDTQVDPSKPHDHVGDLTQVGYRFGTPAYMSPEQAAGNLAVLDERTDIYGLGAILCEILTGQPPNLPAKRASGQIAKSPAPAVPPSGAESTEPTRQQAPTNCQPTGAAEVSAEDTFRGSAVANLRSNRVPRELASICGKALATKPEDRYATAAELAAEVERWLVHEPVAAHAYSKRERAKLWVKRHPGVPLVAGVFAALVIVCVGATAAALNHARVTEAEARHTADKLRADAETARSLANTRWAQFQHLATTLQLEKGLLDASRFEQGFPEEIRSWDSARLEFESRLRRPRSTKVLADGHWDIVAAVQNPDGTRIVSADSSGLVLLWDTEQGRVVRTLATGRPLDDTKRRWLHHYESREDGRVSNWGQCIVALSWLGQSSQFAAASLDGKGLMFQIDEDRRRQLLDAQEPLLAVASSADGQRMLWGGLGGRLFLRSLDGTISQDDATVQRAVTALLWLPNANGWLIGRDDGRLEMRDGETLALITSINTPGPVWSMDVVERDGADLIAVGGGSPDVHLLRCGRGQPLVLVETRPTPGPNRPPGSVQVVRFAEQGRVLYTLDQLGQCIRLNREQNVIEWGIAAIGRHNLREQSLLALSRRNPPLSPLAPFQRSTTALLVRPVGEQVVIAGREANLRFWDVNASQSDGVTRITAVVGQKPRIAFDQQLPHVLWALDQAGTLWAVDTLGDKVVDHVLNAHTGGAADFATVNKLNLVVTVGGDEELKFWKLQNGRIEKARESVTHSSPLLSVAVDPQQRWTACVDDRGKLVVREFATRNDVFVTKLAGDDSRPLTGRVRFNQDGTRLGAFGPGQSAPIFETAPFRQISEQLPVAGNGGIVMAWSAVDADTLLFTDDHPRVHVFRFAPKEREREKPLVPITAYVADTTTADQRRIVLMAQDGTLEFIEPRHWISVHSMRNPRGLNSDVAFDATGRRMALAGSDGRLEVWETEPPRPVVPKIDARDETELWKTTLLVAGSVEHYNTRNRATGIDPQGRVCLLYISSRPTDFRDAGALFFVRHEEERTIRERIEVGDGLDRRADVRAVTMSFQANGEPLVTFRRRTAKESNYEGEVLLARRRGPEDWSFETVAARDNVGFYPAIALDGTGEPSRIFHFSFNGHYLLQSRRVPDAGKQTWQTTRLGWQGDGNNLQAKPDGQGRWHFLFDRKQTNGEDAPPMYARWDGREFLREVIDAAATSLECLQLLPDGTPLVLLTLRGPDDSESLVVSRRTDAGWVRGTELPIATAGLLAAAMDHNGALYTASWNVEERSVVLGTVRGETVDYAQIALSMLDGNPNWASLLVNDRSKPILMFGRVAEPNGWFRQLTKMKE